MYVYTFTESEASVRAPREIEWARFLLPNKYTHTRARIQTKKFTKILVQKSRCLWCVHIPIHRHKALAFQLLSSTLRNTNTNTHSCLRDYIHWLRRAHIQFEYAWWSHTSESIRSISSVRACGCIGMSVHACFACCLFHSVSLARFLTLLPVTIAVFMFVHTHTCTLT